MPKGQPRTSDDRKAELRAQIERNRKRLAEMDKQESERAKKDRLAENFELGAIARLLVETDMQAKGKLVRIAEAQELKPHQVRALERVIGKLKMKTPAQAPEAEAEAAE